VNPLADIVVDGTVRVAFVPTISNQAAPTTAELNAGTLLQSVMTPDGLQNWQPTTAAVDNSALDSTFTTSTIGRDSFNNPTMQFKKQASGDTVYNLLLRATAGFVVIRRYVASGTAWTTGQAVEVYPVICGQTLGVDPAANEVAKYQIPFMVTASATIRAAIP
jgi:hypothetical protein